MVAHTGQIGDTSTTNQHNTVLLQVVALAGNVGVDDLVVRELDTGDLTDGRVGLTGLLGEDTDTDALLLEAGIERRRLRLLFEGLAAAAHDLV